MPEIKVLVVDDDPDQHLLVTEGFSETQVRVVSAFSLFEAVQLIEKNEDIKLILLDLNLGDSVGRDTLVQMKSKSINTPIIVMTNISDVSLEKKLLASGAQDYLVKGNIEYDSLDYLIDKTLLRYQEYQKLQKSNAELSYLITSIRRGQTDEILSMNSHAGLYKLLDATDFEIMLKQLKEQQDKLSYLAEHDYLTGILNRNSFEKQLHKAVLKAKRKDEAFAVINLDIDNFKIINDKFGHFVGDKYLKAIVNLIGSVIGKTDIFARVGGDEFAILLSCLESPEDAGTFVEGIYNVIREGIYIDDKHYQITLSCGIACYPLAGKSDNELHRNSDLALYSAKNSGRNKYLFYDQNIQLAYDRKSSLRNLIESSFDSQFTVALQRIFSTAESTDWILGYEALLRLKENVRYQFSIEEVIEEFLEVGKVSSLTYHLIRKISHHMPNCINNNSKILFINLTVSQIFQPNFIAHVTTLFEQLNILTRQVCFEITEAELIDKSLEKKIIPGLENLKKLGYKIAIDDFGKGYSSLNRLIDFPINYLKLDMSFTQQIVKNRKVQHITQLIIEVANKLDLKVIVEGVESESQLSLLRSLGAHYVQGFLLDTPKVIEGFK